MSRNEKNSICKQKHLLLFSPLDWGLGHTTRSIPLLLAFQAQGWEIVVACNSIQKQILSQEITGIRFVEIGGYGIKYGRNRLLTRLFLALQLPKILTRINKENQWLNIFLSQNAIDLIISDNRYGFYNRKTPAVFITHQLRPYSGFGAVFDQMMQKIIYRFINRFTECWIPDMQSGNVNLAAGLSHPTNLPTTPVRYIGPISRFHKNDMVALKTTILVVISGPEPQRTIFENVIIDELKESNDEVVVVRGLPTEGKLPQKTARVIYHNHLTASALGELISTAAFVVCRSGYTSVMDMVSCKKKMILVPTPGQPEQEYLAAYLMKKKMAFAATQERFSWTAALSAAEKFDYFFPETNMQLYKQEIAAFLHTLHIDH